MIALSCLKTIKVLYEHAHCNFAKKTNMKKFPNFHMPLYLISHPYTTINFLKNLIE